MKGGPSGGNGAINTYTASSSGKAVAVNYIQGMMILALAMGHTVERPAMGMGGGTKILWSSFASRRLNPPLTYKEK